MLSNSGAAITVASGGEIKQLVSVPRDASYKIFARVIDYGSDGSNFVHVSIDNESRRLEWGPKGLGLLAAPVLRRLKRLSSLATWNEVGTFSLTEGEHQLIVRAEHVGQVFLVIDAFYLTDDINEVAPSGVDPRVQRPAEHGTPVKTRRTLHTDNEIAIARSNIVQYEWARQLADDVIGTARPFVELSDEKLWDLMPSTRLPRTTGLAGAPCPDHGLPGNQGKWRVDPIKHSHQLKCPIADEWLQADAVGTKDNADQGVAYYNHQVYTEVIRTGAATLGKAFALTGDSRYAHAAGILLARIASEYPDAFDNSERAYRPPYAATSGTITDNVGSSYDLPLLAEAYDYVFDAIEKDQALARSLRAKIPTIRSGADLRFYIEEHLFRTMARAVFDGAIFGNPGTHDRGLMAVALCLDDFAGSTYPNSHEMIDWIFFKEQSRGSNWSQPRRFVSNYLLPDGCSNSSVDYNSLNLFFVDFAEWLERARALHPDLLPADRYPSLFAGDRLRRHIDFLTELVCLGRYHPANGDGHGKRLWDGDNLTPVQIPQNVVTLAYPEFVYKFFRRRPDEGLASLLWRMGKEGQTLYHDIFDRPRDEEIQTLARRASTSTSESSSVLDDYGIAILRSGAGDNARALWINYDGPQNQEHRNADRLSIGLLAKGLDLMPELPYPRSWSHEQLNNFERHPLLHNTITFDRRPVRFDHGYLERFDRGPDIQLISARSEESGYGFTAQRTVALVDVGDEAYVVDFVRAAGGSEHHLSLHASVAQNVTVTGVDLKARPGTLAGEDNKYGDPMVQQSGATAIHPFSYMTDIESGTAGPVYQTDYKLGDSRDVHLRVTSLPDPDTDVTFADASPPGDPGAYSLRYRFERRRSATPLISRFTTVYEPYSTKPFIDRVERVQVKMAGIKRGQSRGAQSNAVALRVVIGSRQDTFVLNPAGDSLITEDGAGISGTFVFFSQNRGKVTRVLVSGGGEFRKQGVRVRATESATGARIVSTNRSDNSILVDRAPNAFEVLRGKWLRIVNASRERAYRAIDVTREGRFTRIKLDRSALLGEGEAIGVSGNSLVTCLALPFASSGCVVENATGTAHWVLKKMAYRDRSWPDLVLRRSPGAPASNVEQDFRGRSFFVYGYGPGDLVDFPGTATFQRASMH
ncbi:MAG TPA: heparinase II/III family protein, partial [Blastocatellia bacterium]|nr:heparinase II/III family protein [Blastocatellia bacterium]